MDHLIHKEINDDETLQELWKIKDETAHRFKTVSSYAKYLIEKAAMPASLPERDAPSTAFGQALT